MEDASAPPPRLPREGDAAAPGGGQGEEYFDPFPELSDEDKGGDISENGVEGGPAVPGALPEVSQDVADLIYGAESVAAVVDEVHEEHAPDDVPPSPLTLKEDGPEGGRPAPCMAIASGPSDGGGVRGGGAPGECCSCCRQCGSRSG